MEPVVEVAKPIEETGQLADTKRVLTEALSEPDEVYKFSENRALKESWIDEAKSRLGESSPKGQDTIMVTCAADASLAYQPNRGFVASYFSHMGTDLKFDQIKDYVRGDVKLRQVAEGDAASPREKGTVWVTDKDGKNKYLATSTKIDGVQILLDMQHIGTGSETTGSLHPILLVTTK